MSIKFSLFIILSLIVSICIACYSHNGLSSNKDEPSISDINVLLPYSTTPHKVAYIVEAYNGCFKWAVADPQVAIIKPFLENGKLCSNKVEVTAAGAFETRKSTFITAQEIASGITLKCEVFIDKIASIQLQTTPRTLYRDEVKLIEAQAYDSQGNLFSTVIGLQFKWSFPTRSYFATSTMRTIPFRSSFVEVSSIVLEMEDRNLQTSFILAQGIKTGKTEILVTLTEPGYYDIRSANATIIVLYPLRLEPDTTLHIAKNSKIQYKLYISKDLVHMPCSIFGWSSSNKTIATINDLGLLTSYGYEGKVAIVVADRDISENKVEAEVNVVNK